MSKIIIPKRIQKPTLGRVVLVSFRRKNGETRERAGRVVNTWDGEAINATVDLDGSNDDDLIMSPQDRIDARTAAVWSCPYRADGACPEGQAASWRYPPFSKEEIEVDG